MMETSDCDLSLYFESKSNWIHNEDIEFGVTSVKITVNVKTDLEFAEISKSVPKTKEGDDTFNQLQWSERKPQSFNDRAKDSTIPCHSTTKAAKLKLFTEVWNKIKMQRVVLGIILCTLTVGISTPVGLFVIKTLLKEGNASAVEYQIHQNHCKIHDPSMVGYHSYLYAHVKF